MFTRPVFHTGFPQYKANWHLQLPFTPSQDASPSHGSPSPGSFRVSMCTPRGGNDNVDKISNFRQTWRNRLSSQNFKISPFYTLTSRSPHIFTEFKPLFLDKHSFWRLHFFFHTDKPPLSKHLFASRSLNNCAFTEYYSN